MTKQQIKINFRKDLRLTKASFNCSDITEFHKRDLKVITLCEMYLLKHPELKDYDCSGIGLPVAILKHLKAVTALTGIYNVN
jgi:hypothetical protein